MRRLSWALTQMRESGHRNTRPRALVLGVLARADGHLTAEAVHQRAEAAGRLDLSTVYWTLALFERLQMAHTLVIGGRVIYGLADHPHAHTFCDTYARVTALHEGELGELAGLVRRNRVDFVPAGVVIRGRCATCPPQQDP